MPIPLGVRIDAYEVLGVLGVGGMGEVYRARDPILKRDVAIKVLPEYMAREPDRLRRFEQEAQAAAALNHPNILVIYQFGSYNGAPYLASELLEGATLRKHLESGPMPVQKVVDAGVQIASGLAAAHDKGIVHRDLKPENLFLSRDGRVKILDFGLAKLTARHIPADGVTLTKDTDPGIVMGTVGYMSPEQIRGSAVDPRSDIFAFGCILYEMLTGKRAFQRSTSAETMTAILHDEPSSISLVAPVTPPGLQRVVRRCLEKSPEQRFQSASDLAFALEALSDPSSARDVSSTQPKQTLRQRIPLVLWIASVSALALIAFLALRMQSRTPTWHVTEYSQLTHSGNAGEVVATDGSRIYLLSSIWESVGQLAVSGGDIEPFTKLPPRSWLCDVSPDGTTLLYMVYQDSLAVSQPLYSLKTIGGTPRYLRSVSGAGWSRDGNSILYQEPGGDLFRMDTDGSNPRRLLALGDRVEFNVSPNGKIIRYFKNDNLWETTFTGTNPHQLIPQWGQGRRKCCGAWSPDGSVFVFTASPRSQIWALDQKKAPFHKPPEQPTPLTSSPIQWGSPVFSQDGKKILCTGSTPRGELIRLDSKSKQFLPFLNSASIDLLSFSKDGRTIAYVTYPDNILWKSNVDGTARTQLSDNSLRIESLSISPDGSQVAFMATHQNSNLSRAYIVSSRGDGSRLLLPQSAGPETDPRWSPNGHKIAFATNAYMDRVKPSDIRIFDVDTQKVSIFPDSAGKFSPLWSPDGQFLLATGKDLSTTYLADLKTNRWRPIYQGIVGYQAWSHNSRFVYLFRYASDPAILRVPVNGGQAEMVANVKNIRFTGTLGIWFGLDPTDAPLLLRDEGTSDVYALNLQYQ